MILTLSYFQTLPDQQHVFYMNDINGCSLEQPAVMVSKIPFTHPTNVAQVLNCLRQQLIFNTVIGSSIRPNASQGKIFLEHRIRDYKQKAYKKIVT